MYLSLQLIHKETAKQQSPELLTDITHNQHLASLQATTIEHLNMEQIESERLASFYHFTDPLDLFGRPIPEIVAD